MLFDCDGVLVDSDPSVVTAWSRWATEFGLVPAEVVAIVHGRGALDTVAALLAADRHAEALASINRYEIEDVDRTDLDRRRSRRPHLAPNNESGDRP